MNRTDSSDRSRVAPSRRGAFRPSVTLGLASVGLPRVVLHDLDVVNEGDAANLLLTFAPPAVWIVFAIAFRIPNPLRAVTWVGAAYGVLLAATHQLLWDRAFADEPPRLGGNLRGDLSAEAEEIILRGSASVSGIVTGIVIGAFCGIVARCAMRWRG